MEFKSPKRTSNEKTGLHAWHPYYAGYSEAFVDSILLKSETRKLILDPWAGSGTTRLSCIKHGHASVMVDINPAMANYAAAKDGRIFTNRDTLNYQFEQLINHINSTQSFSLADNDPLLEYLPELLVKIGREYFSSIPMFFSMPARVSKKISDVGLITPINPYVAFARVVFLKTAKEMVNDSLSSKNPTWIKKNKNNIFANKKEIIELLLGNFDRMVSDIKRSKMHNKKTIDSACINSDINCTQFKENSFDYIISSPPYLTRIDYAVSTKIENLFLLESETKFNELRRSTLGTTMISRVTNSNPDNWGNTCKKVLNAIHNHKSYAAKSYYYPNIKKYLDTLYLSCGKLKTYLKVNGEGYFVVQNSYFKDVNIDLPLITLEMFVSHGAKCEVVKQFDVTTYMGHLNKHARKHKKVIHESIVKIIK